MKLLTLTFAPHHDEKNALIELKPLLYLSQEMISLTTKGWGKRTKKRTIRKGYGVAEMPW